MLIAQIVPLKILVLSATLVVVCLSTAGLLICLTKRSSDAGEDLRWSGPQPATNSGCTDSSSKNIVNTITINAVPSPMNMMVEMAPAAVAAAAQDTIALVVEPNVGNPAVAAAVHPRASPSPAKANDSPSGEPSSSATSFTSAESATPQFTTSATCCDRWSNVTTRSLTAKERSALRPTADSPPPPVTDEVHTSKGEVSDLQEFSISLRMDAPVEEKKKKSITEPIAAPKTKRKALFHHAKIEMELLDATFVSPVPVQSSVTADCPEVAADCTVDSWLPISNTTRPADLPDAPATTTPLSKGRSMTIRITLQVPPKDLNDPAVISQQLADLAMLAYQGLPHRLQRWLTKQYFGGRNPTIAEVRDLVSEAFGLSAASAINGGGGGEESLKKVVLVLRLQEEAAMAGIEEGSKRHYDEGEEATDGRRLTFSDAKDDVERPEEEGRTLEIRRKLIIPVKNVIPVPPRRRDSPNHGEQKGPAFQRFSIEYKVKVAEEEEEEVPQASSPAGTISPRSIRIALSMAQSPGYVPLVRYEDLDLLFNKMPDILRIPDDMDMNGWKLAVKGSGHSMVSEEVLLGSPTFISFRSILGSTTTNASSTMRKAAMYQTIKDHAFDVVAERKNIDRSLYAFDPQQVGLGGGDVQLLLTTLSNCPLNSTACIATVPMVLTTLMPKVLQVFTTACATTRQQRSTPYPPPPPQGSSPSTTAAHFNHSCKNNILSILGVDVDTDAEVVVPTAAAGSKYERKGYRLFVGGNQTPLMPDGKPVEFGLMFSMKLYVDHGNQFAGALPSTSFDPAALGARMVEVNIFFASIVGEQHSKANQFWVLVGDKESMLPTVPVEGIEGGGVGHRLLLTGDTVLKILGKDLSNHQVEATTSSKVDLDSLDFQFFKMQRELGRMIKHGMRMAQRLSSTMQRSIESTAGEWTSSMENVFGTTAFDLFSGGRNPVSTPKLIKEAGAPPKSAISSSTKSSPLTIPCASGRSSSLGNSVTGDISDGISGLSSAPLSRENGTGIQEGHESVPDVVAESYDSNNMSERRKSLKRKRESQVGKRKQKKVVLRPNQPGDERPPRKIKKINGKPNHPGNERPPRKSRKIMKSISSNSTENGIVSSPTGSSSGNKVEFSPIIAQLFDNIEKYIAEHPESDPLASLDPIIASFYDYYQAVKHSADGGKVELPSLIRGYFDLVREIKELFPDDDYIGTAQPMKGLYEHYLQVREAESSHAKIMPQETVAQETKGLQGMYEYYLRLHAAEKSPEANAIIDSQLPIPKETGDLYPEKMVVRSGNLLSHNVSTTFDSTSQQCSHSIPMLVGSVNELSIPSSLSLPENGNVGIQGLNIHPTFHSPLTADAQLAFMLAGCYVMNQFFIRKAHV